jgi:glutaminyl-peptide cyclotransferase
MTFHWQAAPALAALCALAVGCGGGDPGSAAQSEPGFDGERAMADVRAQVELGPRPAGSDASRRLTRMLAAELRAAGVEDVRVQRPHRNVVGTIPGGGEGSVLIGAHHDTKEGVGGGFEGANDGASGVAVVLELARTLRPVPGGPSIAIALFDAEEARGERPFSEDGTRGSRQYLRYARAGGRQGSPPLGEIGAMVLFDMVGDCDLGVPREANSDPGLYRLFAEADPRVFNGETTPILDDHLPFRQAGIPALDVIDFRYGPGSPPGEYWHTPRDTIDKVCPESLDAVGEAALEVIPQIP